MNPHSAGVLLLAGLGLLMPAMVSAQGMPMLVDDYVVTGTRTERDPDKAPVATQVLTKEELETSGARTLADALAQQPGVTIDRELAGAGAGVRLQGLDPKHVLILIDGQPVLGRFGGTIDLDRFSLEQLDRVEIVKGPSSALYGSDAMGGVINIITTPDTDERLDGEVGASYGTLNEGNAHGTLKFNSGKWSLRGAAGFHRRDAFDLDPTDAASTGGEQQQFNADNRTEYRWNDDLRLVANLRYNYRDRDDIDVSLGQVFERNNLTHEASIALGPTVEFDDDSVLEIVGYYAFFDNALTVSHAVEPDTLEQTFQQLGQATLSYTRPFFQNHDITLVGEGFIERFESDRLNRSRAERMRGAVALQDEWRALKTVQLVGGARVDHDTQFGTYATPKIALRFDPIDALALRGSYGKGFRAPDFKELYLNFNTPNSNIVVRGNPELDAETSHGFNASAEVNIGIISAELAGFRNEISNLILVKPQFTGAPGPPTDFIYRNVAEARTQGLETTVSARVHPTLRLSAGYTLMDAQDLDNDRALQGRATHRGNARISYLPNFGFEGTAAITLVGSRPYYEPQQGGDELEVTADPYAMLDLRLAQRLRGDFKIFGGVRNALDAGEAPYLSVTPRTVYVGLSIAMGTDKKP